MNAPHDSDRADVSFFYDQLGLAPSERLATPDPATLWLMLEETGLLSGDRFRWFSMLVETQTKIFGPAGPLQKMPAGFRIDEAELERGIGAASHDVDWKAWCGRHAGQFCCHDGLPSDDTHVWFESIQVTDAWEVQPVRFADKPLGYNITYHDVSERSHGLSRVHAGYVKKSDVPEDGAHLGFGGRGGGYDWIMWLLPQEAFLEVTGPDPATGAQWRTAFNQNGAWGKWKIKPLGSRASDPQAV